MDNAPFIMNWIDMTLYKTYIKGLLKLTRYFTLHLISSAEQIAKWIKATS